MKKLIIGIIAVALPLIFIWLLQAYSLYGNNYKDLHVDIYAMVERSSAAFENINFSKVYLIVYNGLKNVGNFMNDSYIGQLVEIALGEVGFDTPTATFNLVSIILSLFDPIYAGLASLQLLAYLIVAAFYLLGSAFCVVIVVLDFVFVPIFV